MDISKIVIEVKLKSGESITKEVASFEAGIDYLLGLEEDYEA